MPSTGFRIHRPESAGGRAAVLLLAAATALSFLLVVQNFCLDILPDRWVEILPRSMRLYSPEKTFAYVFDFDGSEPDRWPSPRSRVDFHEDDYRYPRRMRAVDEIVLVGGDRFSHEPGRIVFSTRDNSDPRTNGRKYSLTTPILYCGAIGDVAAAVLLACVAIWWRLASDATGIAPSPSLRRNRWRWHLTGAAVLFLLGLYCNTGTLAPYASTSSPIVLPETGYAYNGDHRHFRVLFDFVDGRGRATWDHAILLRRILFPALGWPLMKLFGFEIGGALASLALNTAAFVYALVLIRRFIGERAGVFCAWILALYPGAAYWAGLPYPYALIFPASLLLMLGLMRLCEGVGGWRLVALSFAMGIAYLGYDLAAFFIPATVIALGGRRRWGRACASAALQLAPSAMWTAVLIFHFGQPLENANTTIYHSVFLSYLHPSALAQDWRAIVRVPAIGADIFFAANFIFIPALFLFVLVVNPFTSRIRFHLAETALLFSGLALFLFLNLAPNSFTGWAMNGTWIARLYQPVFPALVIFAARWWQGLPSLPPPLRGIIAGALAATTLGNALVVFGPILGNPGRVSENAFYRFYNHTEAHYLYAANLESLGRRPLGFPRRQLPPPAPSEVKSANQRELDSLLQTLEANRATLIQNQKAYRDTGRALAVAQSDLHAARLALRRARGEITADEERHLSKPWQDFVPAPVRALLDDPSLDPAGAPSDVLPAAVDPQELRNSIDSESKKISQVQDSILEAQRSLAGVIAELSAVRIQLELALKAPFAPRS
jgi:hypothetical protein